jgi:hypothetical protein
MCRSIKTLRPPVTEEAGPEDFHAAALQYVRKISGFRAPSARNKAAFDAAVDAVEEATRRLLDELEVRHTPSREAAADASDARQPV